MIVLGTGSLRPALFFCTLLWFFVQEIISAATFIATVDMQRMVAARMKATISVDHRVSDGAEAAQFMQALAKYLEEPLRLLV